MKGGGGKGEGEERKGERRKKGGGRKDRRRREREEGKLGGERERERGVSESIDRSQYSKPLRVYTSTPVFTIDRDYFPINSKRSREIYIYIKSVFPLHMSE